MNHDEFEQFIDSAMDELHEKQQRLTDDHGMGAYTRWWFDQETETLDFFDSRDMKVLEATVIDIGSYASDSNTWKWAWANDSVLQPLRDKASPLRTLTDLTGMSIFNEENAVKIDGAPMAWELAAVSVRQLGALGVYRAPSSKRPLASFLAIMKLRHLDPAADPNHVS